MLKSSSFQDSKNFENSVLQLFVVIAIVCASASLAVLPEPPSMKDPQEARPPIEEADAIMARMHLRTEDLVRTGSLRVVSVLYAVK